MADPELAIECRGLSRNFDNFVALDNLNLEVAAHTIFGFLGPNGAGKSTTIKLLTGQIAPTSGCAYIAGIKVEGKSVEAHRHIGYLSDAPQFYNWMRGAEFLEFVGELFGLGLVERRERAKELLKLVGLEDANRRKIGGFSGGMRQRLGIAQAMVNRPNVIFLDEPVSALDPLGRYDVLKLLDSLRAETTVFMSSHVLTDVDRVCDRVAILNKGKLIVEGRTTELKERYTRPALELEVEGDTSGARRFIEVLQKQSWIKEVDKLENGRLKLNFSNEENLIRAGFEIPKLLSAQNCGLRFYSTSLPTLEDIFVQLINEQLPLAAKPFDTKQTWSQPVSKK